MLSGCRGFGNNDVTAPHGRLLKYEASLCLPGFRECDPAHHPGLRAARRRTRYGITASVTIALQTSAAITKLTSAIAIPRSDSAVEVFEGSGSEPNI
jgi:hypothetical protein